MTLMNGMMDSWDAGSLSQTVPIMMASPIDHSVSQDSKGKRTPMSLSPVYMANRIPYATTSR